MAGCHSPPLGRIEGMGIMPKRMSSERRAVYVERRQTDRERTMQRRRDRRDKWAECGRMGK